MRQPSRCVSGACGGARPECSAAVSEALGGKEGLGEGARASLPGYRASHTPGNPSTSGNSRKTLDLEPSDPAQKSLPGVPLPTSPRPALPKFGGYLFLPSQSHTMLVCPNADRAQLECRVCVSVYMRLPRVTRPTGPSSVSNQGRGPLGWGRA